MRRPHLGHGWSAIDTRTARAECSSSWLPDLPKWSATYKARERSQHSPLKKAEPRVRCHFTPFGFDRQGDKLVQNRDELKTVKRILRLRADGLSMQAIADAMNQAGAATKRGGTCMR